MKPEVQTTPTNCFQTCLSWLLGIPIEEAPDLWCDGKPGEWIIRLRAWAFANGYVVVTSNVKDGVQPIPGYCLVGVPSKRPGVMHEVVALCHATPTEVSFKIVFDPSPEPIPDPELIDVVWLVKNQFPCPSSPTPIPQPAPIDYLALTEAGYRVAKQYRDGSYFALHTDERDASALDLRGVHPTALAAWQACNEHYKASKGGQR